MESYKTYIRNAPKLSTCVILIVWKHYGNNFQCKSCHNNENKNICKIVSVYKWSVEYTAFCLQNPGETGCFVRTLLVNSISSKHLYDIHGRISLWRCRPDSSGSACLTCSCKKEVIARNTKEGRGKIVSAWISFTHILLLGLYEKCKTYNPDNGWQ